MARPSTGRGSTDADELALLKGIDKKFGESRDIALDVWPETLPSIKLFLKSLTQWRTGPTGIVGLDYPAVNLIMDLDKIPLDDRGELLTDVTCLERGYIQAVRR